MLGGLSFEAAMNFSGLDWHGLRGPWARAVSLGVDLGVGLVFA